MDARAAAFVHYYAREGYVHHVQSVCNELAKAPHGPGAVSLRLWRAVGLLACGATAEAMRELQAVQQHPEAGPAATAALLAAHQGARLVDHEAVMQLSAHLEAEEPSVCDAAALHLAAFLLYTHHFERARAILERQLPPGLAPSSAAPEELRARALLGFVLLEQQAHEAPELQDASELQAALRLFDGVLQQQPQDLEALLGKARVLEATHQLRPAWELLSEAAIRLPWAVPLVMELARLTLAQQDWEGLTDVVARLQQVDAGNVLAQAYQALSALLDAGDSEAACRHLAALVEQVQQAEPSNAGLMAQLAAPFARLAGGDAALLRLTLSLAERASELQPANTHYAVEVAAQQLLAEQPEQAIARCQAALRQDELNMRGALTLVEAHLAAQQLDEAAQQLKFLPELLAASRAAGSLGGLSGWAEVQSLQGSASSAGLAGAGPPGRPVFGFMRVGGQLWRSGGGARSARASRASDSLSDAGGLQLVAGGHDAVAAVQHEEPQLLYLRGLLAWRQGRQQEGLSALAQGLELQLEAVEDQSYGLGLFSGLNVSRMLSLIRLLLDGAGGDPRLPADPLLPPLSCCLRLLEMLSRFTLAHPEAQLLHARTLFLNGSLDAAARKAAAILRAQPGSGQAALLAVRVHVAQGRPDDAAAALEAAVSSNFSIRDAPLFHVVRAQVLRASGRLDEARKVLEAAMALPGVRSPPTPEQAARLAKRGCLPSTHERASIYLLLVEALTKLSKGQGPPAEAKELLSEAAREFRGTREEARVTVADCEAAIAGGDVTGALQRLKRVPPASPHYTRACVAMAEIHLKHRHDRAAFINCYLQLLDKSPDVESHCLLAEAFMTIHEPDKAARAYESALALRPKDADLALCAAKALISAHDYSRAIDHYNKAIRNDPSKLVLQHGLARLLLRLGQIRPATALLDACLDAHKARSEGSSSSLETLALDVDTWLLLAKLRQQSGEAEGFVAAQSQALELQCMLLEQLRQAGSAAAAAASFGADAGCSSPGSRPKGVSFLGPDGAVASPHSKASKAAAAPTAAASAKAAGICFDLAEFHNRSRQLDKAEAAYNACLSHQQHHRGARLALARLALANGQIDACQAHASALLEEEPDNEDAAIMLAELMSHQGNHDQAVYHFEQLLDRRPCHYTALVQLLGMLRRAGKLHSADKHIAAAEAAAAAAACGGSPGPGGGGGGGAGASNSGGSAPCGSVAAGGACAADAGGLAYCKGLLARYRSNPREALKQLNAARRDARWCSAALLAMAEIYLNPNPDSELAWAGGDADSPGLAGSTSGAAVGAAVGAAAGAAAGAAPLDDEAREAVRAADTLLKQLRPADMEGSSKFKVLLAYTQMASHARPAVEAAVAQLLDLAASDPNDARVLMALAHGFLLLKQTAKARNQLKRLAKLPYKAEDADEFERAWLALADMHIAGGKHDLAQELCSRCLKHNRSCSRAWELLGAIAEREAAFADAAAHYAQAWQLCGHTSAPTGYKLAFTHLKAGRCVEAIIVAQAVLKADPAYPRIRPDVLDKARAGLRP